MASNDERMSIIHEMIETGKKKGMLSYKEIQDSLEELELTAEQIDTMYEQLEKMGIEITGDDVNAEP